jgi:hypothetical protein
MGERLRKRMTASPLVYAGEHIPVMISFGAGLLA